VHHGIDQQKVITMQADLRQDTAAADELLRPAFWLAWGLEWPGDSDMAEAVIACAPRLIARDGLSYSAFQVTGCADVYARKSGLRVVFFSDLTRQLARAGESWEGLRVSWRAELRELEDGPFPGVFLSVSERSYLTLCDPVPGQVVEGRRQIRQAITRQLETDWPSWIQDQLDTGRVRRAS
jgi:hypothetical protein